MRFSLGVFIFLAGGSTAWAFPDTIRHGYTNCTACHVSPAGGGLLNGYGRSLSRELLSTWGAAEEGEPLHGLARIPESVMENFFVGGDARSIALQSKTNAGESNEKFLMQAQLRLGVGYGAFKFLLAAGKIENPRQSEAVRWVAPEYYALVSPKEEIHARVGRFEPIYGLRMPDHNLWVRSELGLVPWAERDTVEFIFEGEKQFMSLAGFQSLSATPSTQQATGYAASLYQIVGERSRLGLSGMNTEGQGLRARTLSAHGTLSFSEKSYALLEAGRVWSGASARDVGFARVGYEVVQGITPIAQWQGKMDRGGKTPDQYRSGLGFIWLPRPHFELMGLVERFQRPKETSTESLLLLHYYL